MTGSVLDHRMRSVLAQLELVSHGSTQAWNSDGRGGDVERWAPPGEVSPPHLEYRRLWLEAADDTARALVRREAEATLQAIRGHGIDRSHVVGETREQEDKRILREGAGETPDRVALVFHCTPTRVRRVRLADGRNVDTGALPPARLAAEADAMGRAREMRGNGMSVRAIAMSLGMPKSTIHDLLRDVA